ncbi:uncharacterized protein LOC125067292 [Vanessa atalanta]|uniref:uncharacterized protein LOC125067292 n=1 Tax=Vanessa atalanta TaxID=42275 RepID=UPI001FCD035A|nr:uncharacterized protein LOC125067292 [Vanessa atalanta]
MFVNGVQVISSRLNNITLTSLSIQGNMHQNNEKTEVCQKGRLPPMLHLTPSGTNQKRVDSSPHQKIDNPWLLKPQHEIPPTPPPQADQKPASFFQQRIG